MCPILDRGGPLPQSLLDIPPQIFQDREGPPPQSFQDIEERPPHLHYKNGTLVHSALVSFMSTVYIVL